LASEDWTSTKAFSVYSVLLQERRALTEDEITEILQKRFRDDIDGDYVALGISYLLVKRMIGTASDGRVGLLHPQRRVKRVNDDIDLDWA
jgi:hypothetical protein